MIQTPDPVELLRRATADLRFIVDDLSGDEAAGPDDVDRLNAAARAMHDVRLDVALLVADRTARFPGYGNADDAAEATIIDAFELADAIRTRVAS